MRLSPEFRENPFRDARSRPEWAQLTRLAGDRASILFEDFRRCLSKIDGLQEELHYSGPERGWAPRYRVQGEVLCAVRVLPGILEGTVELEAPLCRKLLSSPKIAESIKETIRIGHPEKGVTSAQVLLKSPAAVRAFANLVLMKSRFLRSNEAG